MVMMPLAADHAHELLKIDGRTAAGRSGAADGRHAQFLSPEKRTLSDERASAGAHRVRRWDSISAERVIGLYEKSPFRPATGLLVETSVGYVCVRMSRPPPFHMLSSPVNDKRSSRTFAPASGSANIQAQKTGQNLKDLLVLPQSRIRVGGATAEFRTPPRFSLPP
jgi:hypothetical protein